MIHTDDLPELRAFQRYERRLPFELRPEHGSVVVPFGNEQFPVHKWFKYKEAFSAHALRTTIESIIPNPGRTVCLLDPFCGVGTTLLAAQELARTGYHIEATGIEINPFSAFVSRTKTRWHEMVPERMLTLGSDILAKAEAKATELPHLSSIYTGRCISKATARRIITLRESIRNDGSTADHDALLLGVAAAIEPTSKIRRDGRALRLVEKRHPPSLQRIVSRLWRAMADDVRLLQGYLPSSPTPRVIVGDGRRPSACGIDPDSIDLVFTSPPYPNNIDYSEVYKLELWLLGFVNASEDFLSLRRQTFRSHPTCAIHEDSPEFSELFAGTPLRALAAPILRRIDRHTGNWRRKVFLGYCFDLWLSMQEQFRCLRRGGCSVIVVGNSLHGGTHDPYVIPTDLITSAIAEAVGFKVERLIVARPLRRRLSGNHFLRESILVFRKSA